MSLWYWRAVGPAAVKDAAKWWRNAEREMGLSRSWKRYRTESELVVSLGDVTWRRVVTSVKADADGELTLVWGWRVDPMTPGDWWTDVLVGDVIE